MPILDAHTLECFSRSPEQTRRLGMRLGALLQSGDLVCLHGELGAGKTQLVKGLAHGLGITARVHSPTFTLVNEYGGGRLSLFHLDLYRLEQPEQILAAGLDDYLRPDGVAVIEWVERWPALNAEHGTRNAETHLQLRRVTIEVLSENERRIAYEDFVA